MPRIVDWEARFRQGIEKIDESRRRKAGALLSVVPAREDWDEFLGLMKDFWWRSTDDLPCCLLALYDGLAFYEYDANSFWPQFQTAVTRRSLSSGEQQEINTAFQRAARRYGLRIIRRPDSTDYVGSAVHHIGIPLSLWDDFLGICEWASAHENYAELSDEEWSGVAMRLAGPRKRLRTFLLDNREAANDFIKEMHDARRELIKDSNLAISDLRQASLLRGEYFDEVPETAKFLRPQDPHSLIQDRVRLIWDEDQARLSLQLPAVANHKLPTTWGIGEITQPAASTPDTLTLNGEAFVSQLSLELVSEHESETLRLPGIPSWGLFDLEWGRFVNPHPARERLPLHSYAILSRTPLDDIRRKGFDEEDSPINDRYELEDGTAYSVTHLFPVEENADLFIAHGEATWKLIFRSRSTIEGNSDTARDERHEESENPFHPVVDPGQLVVGDYVVHTEHGTAQYRGLRYMTFEEIPGDYLCLEYAGGDKFYASSRDIGLIRKHVGSKSKPPPLAHLKKSRKRRKRS